MMNSNAAHLAFTRMNYQDDNDVCSDDEIGEEEPSSSTDTPYESSTKMTRKAGPSIELIT